MLQKGHHNLLTCLNEVPATFDINYVHLGSVLGRRRRCSSEAGDIPPLPRRDQNSVLPPDVRAAETIASRSEALLVFIHLCCCNFVPFCRMHLLNYASAVSWI